MSRHAKKPNAIATTSKKARILVVDDEDDITRMLLSALHRSGKDAVAFNDPEKALEAFRPGLYDLAIIDIRMPGMNGYELVKNLKSIDKNLKTCFLTAFEIEKEDLIQNDVLGTMDCSIKKPVRLSEFIKKVNMQLEAA